jgi:hypothetical protein
MPHRPFLPLALIALAAACSSPEDVADKTGVTASARAGAAKAQATAVSGKERSVKEETDLYEFAYSYPGAAARIPALASWFDSQVDEMKASLVAEAREGKADSETGGYPYNPHSFSQEWKVVADLPDWLSLSGKFSTYSGGAHGNYGMDSFVWQKDPGRKLETVALFRSPAALTQALEPKLCNALNAERAERRGQPVVEGSDDMFDQCVGVDEATVLLGSSNGKTFDRLGVWIGPYVAGPYAEGSFELDFPVDKAVLAAVKPEYRAAFSVMR